MMPIEENSAATGDAGAPSSAPFVIPPLSKTSTGLQRRQDLAERDQKLADRINEISLQQSSNDNSNVGSHKTPGKKSNRAPKTPGAATTSTTPGRSRPAPVAMPSPGLRRIRERLGDDENSSATFGSKNGLLSKEDLIAQEQASRAMAEAETSAAAAIDAIFAQQEGTLLAMSAALKSGGDGSGNGNNSVLLSRIAKAVEETTREQLAALSGVSKEGDDILQTAVYWITLARFESTHGREEAARKYLTDGIDCMERKHKSACGQAASTNTTQINALRLALDRMDKKQSKNEKKEEDEAGQKERGLAKSKPTKPRLPPPAVPKAAKKSPGRRSRSQQQSATSAKDEAPVTPTRRSSRIKAKSAEKEKK